MALAASPAALPHRRERSASKENKMYENICEVRKKPTTDLYSFLFKDSENFSCAVSDLRCMFPGGICTQVEQSTVMKDYNVS